LAGTSVPKHVGVDICHNNLSNSAYAGCYYDVTTRTVRITQKMSLNKIIISFIFQTLANRLLLSVS